ncbi:MAG: glycoside hydrolase family 32 protein [Bacteroidetes bacterium]|nr:glycoside hydrolase family 32 protein [Bacteroidota bacterium]
MLKLNSATAFILMLILSACSNGNESTQDSVTRLHLESPELRNLMPPELRYAGKEWLVYLAEREPVFTWQKKLSRNLIDFRDTVFSPNETLNDFIESNPESFMWRHEPDGSKWFVGPGKENKSIIFFKRTVQGATETETTFKPEIQWGETWRYPSITSTGLHNNQGQEYYILTATGENPSGRPFTTTHYFIGTIDKGYFLPDHKIGAHGYLDYGKDFFGGRFILKDRQQENTPPTVIGLASNEAYFKDLPKSFGVRLSFPRNLSIDLVETERWIVKQQPVQDLWTKKSKTILTPGELTGIQQAWLELKVPSEGTEETGIVMFKTARQELRIGYSPLSKTLFIDRTRSGRIDFTPLFASIDRMQVNQKDGWVHFQILLDAEMVEVFADDGSSVMTSAFYPEEPYGKAEWFGPDNQNEFNGYVLKR